MRTIGYIRPHRSCTAQKQRAAMEAAGITTVYVEGQGAETLSEAIRALRPGTRLAVMHAALLAEPARTTKSRPRDSLFAALEKAQGRGGVLWELETGRTSDEHCLAIMRDAVDALAKGGRGLKSAINGARSRGAPPKDWSQWRDTMEREWTDLRHSTNADAVESMKAKGVPIKNVRQAIYVLGKSGRGN